MFTKEMPLMVCTLVFVVCLYCLLLRAAVVTYVVIIILRLYLLLFFYVVCSLALGILCDADFTRSLLATNGKTIQKIGTNFSYASHIKEHKTYPEKGMELGHAQNMIDSIISLGQLIGFNQYVY